MDCAVICAGSERGEELEGKGYLRSTKFTTTVRYRLVAPPTQSLESAQLVPACNSDR